ncbi:MULTISPECIES: UDP-N-acetylmuramoyl-L-alanyl-D-glutamate--2,6-diaminopimelate ligase [unclassified Lactobacillus]|uniref:UDP-N-acetylmuramoyl-L-alanyl-D-glutamate--2, 6-diaminopimelate ligase n=1 Tax=unclassified Lactobacillus TaxID=2620435 RepID=UPI0023F8C347|nr:MULTISPECIES: UDP-N-acetylmuramoyl-L-alanyl-D-glutamate--2,6-diaminopimelate ligase [unclassified Lactobacillus]MDF7669112.1 UDP-N-acetylmuramoyl-L-alanyl-D-glutamate--2,6-diaminopimelate ligase [Lactobacillus sp. ESL0703]WEV38898.1 UDP-N-acetylmuramoyl-L-alanyl-D-glutamate--2,6-diaminopimelate ligase [Lactobacillus sp. ESL0680]
MSISLNTCILILKEHHLLKSSAVQDTVATKMEYVSYDSRDIKTNTLFFCKGAGFRPTYLSMAKDNGANCYVAEQPYPEGKGMHALIVRDVSKAMALLSAAFFRFPQDDLFVVAITGTKGKTTTAYFIKGMLDQVNGGKTALISSVNDVVGTNPEDTFKSSLTTPESLDLFRDMRRAVDNGMTHLVMEVSSQAYKKNRVFGLTYDLGFFLNISPDHIGPNEHPNFADYLHCKLQLMVNARKCIINAQSDHFDEIYAAATTTTDPDSIYLFADEKFTNPNLKAPIDFRFASKESDMAETRFQVLCATDKAKELKIAGDYQLKMLGDFNESNGTAAIIGAGLAGLDHDTAAKGISDVTVPGRMQTEVTKDHGIVVVDYAHNKASMMALMGFMQREFNNPKIIVVVGAPGDKGVSRRPGFSQSLNAYADKAFLTSDDPGFEDPKEIAEEINAGIDHDKVDVTIELDRNKAIHDAISMAHSGDVVLICGKGADGFQKVRGIDTPYPSDIVVAQQVIDNLEGQKEHFNK